MDRESVSSSNIASIGYDADSETLEVEFLKGGKVYHYFNVPKFVHEQLMQADSVGTFFNAEIRDTYPSSPA